MDAINADLRLGFIGAGNMAQALIKGFILKGIPPANIYVSAPSDRSRSTITDLGCSFTNINEELFPGGKYNCNVIFVCVKPYMILNHVKQNKLFMAFEHDRPVIVISVLAGVRLEDLNKAIVAKNSDPSLYKLYRTMPNTAVSLAEGVIGITGDSTKNDQLDAVVKTLLSRVSLCQFVAENLLDAVVGVAGSAIAFAYEVIQGIADGGLKMGLSRDISFKFAAQTLIGAGSMVLNSGKHPMELRDQVTTPGGSTIAGLHVLEKAGIKGGLIDAVECASKKATEMSRLT